MRQPGYSSAYSRCKPPEVWPSSLLTGASQGTNPQEGEAAVYSFLQYVGQHFGASGHCLLIDSLHFERPTLLGKQPGFVNKHVRIERDAHGFRYTYQLADGIAPQDARIGIDILAQEGFPATLVASGRDVLQHPDKYQVPG